MLKLALLLFLTTVFAADKGRQANLAYEKGQFEEAIRLYQEALKEDPTNTKLFFNLGNALSKAGRNEDALGAWETFRSASGNPADQAKAEYNMAHALGKMQQWDKALQLYKNALRKAPDDAEARYNYELALKQKQEEEKQKQDQKKDDQDKKEPPKDDQKKDDPKQDEQQQQQQQPEQNQDQKQEQKQQKPKNEMSKEQAEKILKALENKEKDLLKEIKKQKSPQRPNAKDW